MKNKRKGNYRIKFTNFREIIRNPSISHGAKVVFTDLLLYAGVGGISFPSQETLAKNHNVTSRQIRNYLSELKIIGVNWIRGGFGKSNRYIFSKEVYFQIDDEKRKADSFKLGNKLPVENGKSIPPNVVNEGNHINDSQLAQLEQLLEKINKRKLSEFEKRQLNELCEKYTFTLVKNTIIEADRRRLPYIAVGLITLILQDKKLQRTSSTSSSSSIIYCGKNGCEKGYVFDAKRKIYKQCDCIKKLTH